MKKKEILWADEGWTVLQDADAKTHTLEISCLTNNGNVIEIRKRHNDGEEEILKAKLNDDYSLPMTLVEFKKIFSSGKLNLK